jgi:DNA-binding CsgD family transcriptional regulator
MTELMSRAPLESADAPLFRHALNLWQTLGPTAGDAAATALIEACDATAPLYLTDLGADSMSGWSVTALNRHWDLNFRSEFRVADHPDQRYFHQIIAPAYLTLLRERRPNFHLLRTRIDRPDLGRSATALYQRLLLPFERKDGGVTALHLARTLMVVEEPPMPLATPLSPRERECLGHLIVGRSAKQIAFDTELSQKTIENCIERVRRKLDVATGAQAAAQGILGAQDRSSIGHLPDLSLLFGLSSRERQCVGLLASGYTSAGIGDRLALSRKTIEKLIDRAKRKLGAGNTPNLVTKGVMAMTGQDHLPFGTQADTST